MNRRDVPDSEVSTVYILRQAGKRHELALAGLIDGLNTKAKDNAEDRLRAPWSLRRADVGIQVWRRSVEDRVVRNTCPFAVYKNLDGLAA